MNSVETKACKKQSWSLSPISPKQVFFMGLHFHRFVLNNNNSHQDHSRIWDYLLAIYGECHGLAVVDNTLFYRWYITSFIFFLGIANHYTSVILLKSKNLSKHSTYNSIAYHLYSSKLCTLILSFLNMFGNVGFGNLF